MIKRYKKNEIEKLVKILKNDGVISVPTDTVFGICARINSKIAHDKLIKTQESNDLSTTSWIIWVVSSFSYLLYAFLCSNEFMLKFETVLEFSFCLLILILTIYYRKK